MTYQLQLDSNGYVQGCDLPSPSIVPDLPKPAPGTPWMPTLEGGWVDLRWPQASQINLRTVAIILARTPRYNGHTLKGPYSVAQHCVEGAKAILRDGHGTDAAAAFLLHDAHEAYMGDITTPVVEALSAFAKMDGHDDAVIERAFGRLKGYLDTAIYLAAGVHYPGPHRDLIRWYDLRMLRTERDARLAPQPQKWSDSCEHAVPVEGCDLYPWSEDVARSAYMEMLRDFDISC